MKWYRMFFLAVLAIVLAFSMVFSAACDDDDDDDDDSEPMPDSLIVAGSRTGTSVVLNPDTGNDIVEVAPETISMNVPKLGYQGLRVYFISPAQEQSGIGEIFGVDTLTGEHLQQVTDFDHLGVEHLDGSTAEAMIVFDAYVESAEGAKATDYSVFSMAEDGTGLTRLTEPGETHALLGESFMVESISESMPAWSPDGTLIAYMSRVGEVDNIGHQFEAVVVMNADGGEKEIIYAVEGTGHYDDICWTSDGHYVIFSHADGNDRVIMAVLADTIDAIDLSDALILDDWTYGLGNMWTAPAGMKLAVTERAAGGGHVHIATLEVAEGVISVTDGPALLTGDVGHGYALPDWGPYTPES